MRKRTTAVIRRGFALLVDKTYRTTTLAALAFTLAYAPSAYACTHGQDFYKACGAYWGNWWQNTEICVCDCVGGNLVTNCHPML